MKIWRIGIIGIGGIGKDHMRKIQLLSNAEVSAICDVNTLAVQECGDQLNLPEHKRYSRFQDIIADAEVDIIISGVSNKYHCEILKCAITMNKPIISEKPFTRTIEEAEELYALYQSNPIPCMIGFSYRYIPCFQYVRTCLNQGTLGQIRHIAAHYLQEENAPMFNHEYTWRFSSEFAGSGILADIGSHMIDAARFFVGEFIQVSGMMSTFINERIDKSTNEKVEIDVDDFTGFQCVLEGEVMGTFYTHKNAIGTGNQFNITLFGDLGTARISVEQPNQVHLTQRDPKTLELVEKTVHLEQGSSNGMIQDFIDYLNHVDTPRLPTFMDGYQNQKIMQLIIDSAKDGIVKVNENLTRSVLHD